MGAEDHPRVCGENSDRINMKEDEGGSPPRVRGKLKKLKITLDGRGITPACAGKTFAVAHFLPRARDHPRVCGENQKEVENEIRSRGSPPRVRGKLYRLRAARRGN